MHVEFIYDKETTDKIIEFHAVLEEYTANLLETLRGLRAEHHGTECQLHDDTIRRMVVDDKIRLDILQQITKLHALSVPVRIEIVKD